MDETVSAEQTAGSGDSAIGMPRISERSAGFGVASGNNPGRFYITRGGLLQSF